MRSITHWMSGYNIFVSYAHSDASEYAKALLSVLDERRFVQFLDVESILPEADIEATLQRALKNSSYMIFLITSDALRSKWAPWELETFAKKRPNSILPVEICSSLEMVEINDTRFDFFRDRIRIQDDGDAQVPPSHAVTQIEVAILTWRKNRLRLWLICSIFVVGFASGAAFCAVLLYLLRWAS